MRGPLLPLDVAMPLALGLMCRRTSLLLPLRLLLFSRMCVCVAARLWLCGYVACGGAACVVNLHRAVVLTGVVAPRTHAVRLKQSCPTGAGQGLPAHPSRAKRTNSGDGGHG